MKGRALTTLTFLCWSASAAAPARAGDVYFLRGDANGSGKVDVSDPVFVLNHLFNGGESIACMDAADANDSGAVDVSDPIFTLLFLFAGGMELPAPGLECGYDPTLDGIGCRSAGGTCLQPSRFFEVIDGYAVVEGDIIIGRPEDFPGVPDILLRGGGAGFVESDPARRWPRGFVPFVIQPGVIDQHRITDAMRHWENVTPIRFGQRTTETLFVTFRRGEGCSSRVGRQNMAQEIRVSDLCTTGNMIHEIGHCVGLYHEHTRNDRDTHVEILWDNIAEGFEDQFEKGSPDDWDVGPYDYGSVMHYSEFAFGKNDGMGGNLRTIKILGTVPQGVTVGQRLALSQGDREAVSFLYGGWQDWTRMDTGFSVPTRSPVTSISRSPKIIDVFVIGKDGRVWSNFWNDDLNNGFWNSWFPIGPDSTFPAQEIAAVSRYDSHLDLFVVGHDGVVYSAFWDEDLNQSLWSSWFPIDSTFHCPPQKIAAVSRHPGQIDLFAIGNDGRVWSSFWNGLWSGWFPIGDDKFPLQPIAALTREQDKLDLFVVGNDGLVWSNFWNESFNEGRWNSWFPLDSTFTCPPQGIAAIARLPGQIDLFVVGSDDHIWSIFWSGAWSNWFPIDASLEVPVQNVSVVHRGPGTIDLFVMGKDRRVWSNYWHDGQNGNAWAQWFPLEEEAFDGPAPAGISPVSRDFSHIDLFATLSDGGVHTNWWVGE